MTEESAPHPSELWRRAYERSGLTQAEVARQMNVSGKHLNQIVNGHAVPSASMTVRFANVTSASPTRLFMTWQKYLLAEALAEFAQTKVGKSE